MIRFGVLHMLASALLLQLLLPPSWSAPLALVLLTLSALRLQPEPEMVLRLARSKGELDVSKWGFPRDALGVWVERKLKGSSLPFGRSLWFNTSHQLSEVVQRYKWNPPFGIIYVGTPDIWS